MHIATALLPKALNCPLDSLPGRGAKSQPNDPFLLLKVVRLPVHHLDTVAHCGALLRPVAMLLAPSSCRPACLFSAMSTAKELAVFWTNENRFLAIPPSCRTVADVRCRPRLGQAPTWYCVFGPLWQPHAIIVLWCVFRNHVARLTGHYSDAVRLSFGVINMGSEADSQQVSYHGVGAMPWLARTPVKVCHRAGPSFSLLVVCVC